MWGRFQYWIVKRWLLSSYIDIINKENGFTNIQVKHPKYCMIVLHPNEELEVQDREKGFAPFLGYILNRWH